MTQKSYAQIQKQIEALQKQADKLKAEEVAGVIARIKDAIAHYGLTAEQLGYGGTRGAKTKAQKLTDSKVAAYSDGAGNSWRGRGPRPQWLKAAIAAGRSLDEFTASGSSLPAATSKVKKKNEKNAIAKKRVATTYRDEAGNKWSGFGPRPRWLKEALEAGKTLEQLAG
ncbi:H-NS family nucleoid-associated regulatory protein [Variovorax sp. OV700]|jgi:DNA-binding protein H-NS|uniref:H-NS family nucleoid-associated regulatory protein n=1 Tax=Variovorax sp. OV700 TaxID=1882826 RepID=UPI000890B16B|nr:H-NS family nucleoid-associated regulatory protein [Variovorax sp. OV700]SDJ16572.1 DNA-binding protein H-NS [Variovorax sp. OV700]